MKIRNVVLETKQNEIISSTTIIITKHEIKIKITRNEM